MMPRPKHPSSKAFWGWDESHMKKAVSSTPQLLSLTPQRIATNMRQLQEHGFDESQVRDMCSCHNKLLTCNWSSAVNVEKVAFLTEVLGLTLDDIAARPDLLARSLQTRLGPRTAFLLQHSFLQSLLRVKVLRQLSNVTRDTDAKFAARYSSAASGRAIQYNQAFCEQWQQRWTFLRQDMNLSVKIIAAHEELLLASLHNTLAPRWQVLAGKRAGIRAEDHLQAMATMSEEAFAEAYGTTM